uniref:Ig-like domain-containing protein n=1 Tax=Astyanax mexicanus TaxID=7994 RepID=A0A8B9GVA1_ASTMX
MLSLFRALSLALSLSLALALSLSFTMIGYRGETADIRCSYPEEFQINYKTFYKWDGQNFSPVISTNQSQKDRFSTFDDRRSNVARMRIRDVREDDGGLYSCAVEVVGESITYYTRYTRIQLMVKGEACQLYKFLKFFPIEMIKSNVLNIFLTLFFGHHPLIQIDLHSIN